MPCLIGVCIAPGVRALEAFASLPFGKLLIHMISRGILLLLHALTSMIQWRQAILAEQGPFLILLVLNI